tara:strand:- start:2255 stop:2494 length:240 start_codon:yes stop_codon:yes gene_type:complete
MSQATFCLIVSSGAIAVTWFWFKVCDLIKRLDRVEIAYEEISDYQKALEKVQELDKTTNDTIREAQKKITILKRNPFFN